MSEIEQLYKNAGVEPIDSEMKPMENLRIDSDFIGNTFTREMYMKEIPIYPPFTAEKQLLLLQWLLDKTDLYLHRHKTDFTYSIASGDIAVNKYQDFKESIAEFINAIWQDLTEEERKQIAEILRG